jgi:hypothetical protein
MKSCLQWAALLLVQCAVCSALAVGGWRLPPSWGSYARFAAILPVANIKKKQTEPAPLHHPNRPDPSGLKRLKRDDGSDGSDVGFLRGRGGVMALLFGAYACIVSSGPSSAASRVSCYSAMHTFCIA